MEAIILAGGFGTRLKEIIKEVPKPMALINGRPFLEYQINYLKYFGVKRVIMSVGYKYEFISSHFKNEFNNIEIDYAIEEEPLGTGGGIQLALNKIKDTQALVVNGDTLFEVDIVKFFNFFKDNNADMCLALRKLDDVSRYGTVEINQDNEIFAFKEKKQNNKEGYINGGVYILKKNIFEDTSLDEKFSLEKDFFEAYIDKKQMFGYLSDDYFLDIGIPEDYNKAQDEFKRFKY